MQEQETQTAKEMNAHPYDKDKQSSYPYICNGYGDIIYLKDGIETQGTKQDYEEHLRTITKMG